MKIEDLEGILTALRKGRFSSSKWHNLGLELGLLEPDLSVIKHDKHNADPCLTGVVTKWLEKNEATYKGLVDALRKMEQKAVADYITSSKCIVMWF